MWTAVLKRTTRTLGFKLSAGFQFILNNSSSPALSRAYLHHIKFLGLDAEYYAEKALVHKGFLF